MKNPNQILYREEFQAKKAVQQIQTLVERKFPRVATSTKTRMIVECLIELIEERKFLTTHR